MIRLYLILILFSSTSMAEFSAILEQELALEADGKRQKFETTIQGEWNSSLNDSIDMTVIIRGRFDGGKSLGFNSTNPPNYSSFNGAFVTSSKGDIQLREWFITTEFLNTFWKIGKQQVVWGQADGLKILDVINPQSFREFILDDFDDSRIPTWMVNAEVPLSAQSTLQVLWIPDTTYNEFALTNSPYEITSPLFVPQLSDGVNLVGFKQSKPKSFFKDSDFGLRYSVFAGGWDLTLNYFYHYLDSPVLFQNLTDANLSIDSQYQRSHLLGASASNAFGDFTLRTELGYSSDTFHLSRDLSQSGIVQSSDVSTVIGLDYQGISDTLLSVQWFASHLFDYEQSMVRDQNTSTISFLIKRSFQNETWDMEILALHNSDNDDGSLQMLINYALSSHTKLWFGTDVFYGNKDGLFGQFSKQDRLTIGVQWGL